MKLRSEALLSAAFCPLLTRPLFASLQQWPMYMVDYSGVNVQVPGKVNYWRTKSDCGKEELVSLPQRDTRTFPRRNKTCRSLQNAFLKAAGSTLERQNVCASESLALFAFQTQVISLFVKAGNVTNMSLFHFVFFPVANCPFTESWF